MKLYLSSYEYNDFEIPKRVLRYYKAVIDNRNILTIEVDKPLTGQQYGWGGEDIKKFYLVNRFKDDEDLLEKLDKFPIHIHVLITKDSGNLNPSSLSELQNIAWACLYNNEEDARNHKIE